MVLFTFPLVYAVNAVDGFRFPACYFNIVLYIKLYSITPCNLLYQLNCTPGIYLFQLLIYLKQNGESCLRNVYDDQPSIYSEMTVLHIYSLVCEHSEFAQEKDQTLHKFGTNISPIFTVQTTEDTCPCTAGDVPTGWYYSVTLNCT